MRKEWISYLHFQTRRAEQKLERKRKIHRRERFVMKNASHIHMYNFYNKFYMNWLRNRRITNYLY